ncbi:hypothetical protein K493DRAFT_306969 [Basidiobolus meristosporus CBS 931.73]|uniref:Uncharacterized protein n=1 Tax=Basidiobolus meristosporus CBS 931.73 TaxID=1314790 RepID=A0A1Y1XMQ2_9FUNG|nr:hypothetical protein K493DRAFT_306969 [Basidiobolus meristosporus CBS 931.73]|eukprot:ORX87011.1 hypothetical protein K493DRAFT_306969 [Basidiobolus meristosporus CBS 931.73]
MPNIAGEKKFPQGYINPLYMFDPLGRSHWLVMELLYPNTVPGKIRGLPGIYYESIEQVKYRADSTLDFSTENTMSLPRNQNPVGAAMSMGYTLLDDTSCGAIKDPGYHMNSLAFPRFPPWPWVRNDSTPLKQLDHRKTANHTHRNRTSRVQSRSTN